MYLEEQISNLVEKIDELNQKVDLFLPNLETEKGVMHFLEITRETYNGYLNKNTLIEGVHYIKQGKRKVFIPSEIIELKKLGIKGKRIQNTRQDQVNSIKEKLGLVA